MKSFIKILLLITISSTFIFSQGNSNEEPCSQPEAKQFDFWVGDWKAEWVNSEGTKVEGTNSIRKFLSGCVVEENFSGAPGNDLTGKSLSVYNPKTKKWEQTWVDNYGSFMVFSGEYKNGKMILGREFKNPEGKTIKQRMTFQNIEKNSFDWLWEKSTDGKNWELAWQIHYSRYK